MGTWTPRRWPCADAGICCHNAPTSQELPEQPASSRSQKRLGRAPCQPLPRELRETGLSCSQQLWGTIRQPGVRTGGRTTEKLLFLMTILSCIWGGVFCFQDGLKDLSLSIRVLSGMLECCEGYIKRCLPNCCSRLLSVLL